LRYRRYSTVNGVLVVKQVAASTFPKQVLATTLYSPALAGLGTEPVNVPDAFPPTMETVASAGVDTEASGVPAGAMPSFTSPGIW
jgi:hypothetical protein